MADVPIGKSSNDPALYEDNRLTSNIIVLDGGTGFLKVGYAGTVYRFNHEMLDIKLTITSRTSLTTNSPPLLAAPSSEQKKGPRMI